MARARVIKPTFFTNEHLAELPPLGRLLFIGLWTIADREGRLEDRPARIRAVLFPYEQAVDTDELLQQLHDAGFIQRYAVGEGSFIEISAFEKHQKPHPRETASEIPAPAGRGQVSAEVVPGREKAVPSREKALPQSGQDTATKVVDGEVSEPAQIQFGEKHDLGSAEAAPRCAQGEPRQPVYGIGSSSVTGIGSSSVGAAPPDSPPAPAEAAADDADDGALPVAIREKRDTLLSWLPARFQHDALTRDECEQLAQEYELDALTEALRQCRRAQRLPFPGNLREHLPPLEDPNGKRDDRFAGMELPASRRDAHGRGGDSGGTLFEALGITPPGRSA